MTENDTKRCTSCYSAWDKGLITKSVYSFWQNNNNNNHTIQKKKKHNKSRENKLLLECTDSNLNNKM